MPITTSQEKNTVLLTVEGKDYKQVFVDGARGLFHVLYDTDAIRDDERVEFALDAESIADLYHAWLTELVRRSDEERLVFGEFSVMSIQKVSVKQYVLMGAAAGERGDSHPKKATLQKIRTDKLLCKESGGVSLCSITIDVT